MRNQVSAFRTGWQRRVAETALIRQQFRGSRRLVAAGVCCLMAVNALEVMLPLIMKTAIDALAGAAPLTVVVGIAAFYLLAAGGQALCRFGWRVTLAKAGMRTARELRRRIGRTALRLPLSFFDRTTGGQVVALAGNDTEAVSNLFSSGVVILVDALFFLVTVPLAMLWLSPRLSVVTFIPLLVVPLLVINNDRKIHRRFRDVQASFAGLTSQAQEALAGARVIKGLGREASLMRRYDDGGKEYVKHNVSLARTEALFGASVDAAATSAMLLLLFAGGSAVIQGAITVGTFLALQRYVQQLIWPVQALGLTVTILQKGVASSLRIQRTLDEEGERIGGGVKDDRAPASHAASAGPGIRSNADDVSVHDLSFSYPDGTAALRNVSFNVKAGSWTAIVGDTGSGKTTLLQLLTGLYESPPGKLFLGGRDVRDIDLSELRPRIAFATQDAQLFALSLADNLRLNRTYSEQDLRLAVTAAAFDCDAAALPAGFDTLLSERGMNLSGGQRQRLALARALLKDAPLLVIDDVFAALDVETEARVLSGLRQRVSGKTVIVTGHRLAAARLADEIVVLQHGRVIQKGRHDDLRKQSGSWYARFVERQMLEEELAHYDGEE